MKDLKKKLEIAKKEKNETEIKSLEHSLEDLKVKVSKQHLTFAIHLVICNFLYTFLAVDNSFWGALIFFGRAQWSFCSIFVLWFFNLTQGLVKAITQGQV